MKETWDLLEVSKEEFAERMADHKDIAIESTVDLLDDVTMVAHYYAEGSGSYLGTIKCIEEGTVFLVPEFLGNSISELELSSLIRGS